MDIRSFFGGKKAGSQGNSSGTSSSSLSVVKEAAPATPLPEVKKRSHKIEANATTKKEKSSKGAAIPIVNLGDDDDSEGESPLPASLRKGEGNSELKRLRRAMISDSDDDDMPPPRSSRSRVESITPSPVKCPPKSKRSRLVVYDSDEDESPTKKQSKIEKTPDANYSSSDDEEIYETDSEDEFVEKKKKKGALLPGQKKLQFDVGVKKGVVAKGKKQTENLKPVSAADFFGSNDVAEKSSSRKNEPAKSSKVSPSQKENSHVKSGKPNKEKVECSEGSVENIPLKQRKADDKKGESKRKTEKKVEDRKISPQKDKPRKGKGKSPSPNHDKSIVSVSDAVDVEMSKSFKGEVFVPWVDKYKPKTTSHLVGQHGDKSPFNKLLGWLKQWGQNNLGEGGKIKKARPPPFMAQSDGAPFKAVLLSGSPGIGKTTCAALACRSLGLKIVEMNASDVRNKKSLEQQITQLTESHQIEEYFTSLPGGTGSEEEVKHALIMDEVDGMSGTEDRAGMVELIQIIKDTKIPIICICNDRQHPKIRSLANYCFDVRFQKPRVEQIRARLMSIACQEKVKISKEELDQMIELSGHDVRQSVYNLQLYASAGGKSKVQKKDVAVGPFEAARKLLDSRSTLQEKQDMFFVDYGIMPLFVQENYPNMRNDKHTPKQAIAGLRKAADLISHGDTIERCIRSTGTWKLLNEQAIIGCALPSIVVDGHLRAMIQFPAWLGKNSTANKRQRLMRQLANHAHLKISADTHSLVADYLPVLRDCLTKPLLERETDGVYEVVCTMNDYDLVREDSEAVSELAVWPGKVDPASKILPKVKAALTRALNKEHRMLPYATDEISKTRKRGAQVEYEVDEEGNLIEKMDEDESGYEDDSDDVDYKPGGKSKAKAKAGGTAPRGRGRGASAGAVSRGSARKGRGK